MKYNLKHLDREKLGQVLDIFSEMFLSIPINKHPKSFEKEIKGFRANKLPRNKLQKIYFNEIQKGKNSVAEYIEKGIQEQFDNNGISNVLDNYNENIISLYLDLIKKKNNINLPLDVSIIIEMSSVKINNEDKNQLLMLEVGLKQLIDNVEDLTWQKLQQKMEELNNKISDLNGEHSKLKSKHKETNTILNTKKQELEHFTYQLKALEEKYQLLTDKNQELREENKDLVGRVSTEKELSKKASDTLKNKIKEIEALTKANSELMERIGVLEEKALSPNDVNNIVGEIVEDLKDGTIENDLLIESVHKQFNEDTTLVEAWGYIKTNSIEIVSEISEKMSEEKICARDIEKLDVLENNIYIEYMVVKSMKVLFYRYLEQIEKNKKIQER